MKKLSEYLINEEKAYNWEEDENYISELTLMLENALAEELIAFYQYTMAWPFVKGKERNKLESVLKDNAKDELEDHAYWLLERLDQLNKQPETIKNIDELNKFAKHKYIIPSETNNILTCIDQVAEAERGAIETYTELIEFTNGKDDITYKKMKEILKDEEKHLKEMQEFTKKINEYYNKDVEKR